MTQFYTAERIVRKLQDRGFEAVYAGGCVRDMLLDVEPNDIDIATNATPDQIEGLFGKTLSIGKAFGVIVVIEDEAEFEVATFRSDGQYSDGRRPDSVEFSSMKEDAKRRDLTINGMFFDPISEKLYDFVGGEWDLKLKIVRLIGTAEHRINEDRLRMLRAIRFATRFNFQIEEITYQAICHQSSEINIVSAERIRDEITKTLKCNKPSVALKYLIHTGLLQEILPEVVKMIGCEQPPEFHPEGAMVRKI